MDSKKIVFLALLLIIIGSIIIIGLRALTNREVVSELQIINSEGTMGTVLIVYHPGLSKFQEDVTKSFADGLVSTGWRVELTTASSEAPKNIMKYDFLVLGSPTYGSAPARPLLRYIDNLGDLEGKSIILIFTAGGSAQESLELVNTRIQEANGSVVLSIALTSIAPNNEQYGVTDPKEIAYRAGTELTLPK